jgi:hypothetical protein
VVAAVFPGRAHCRRAVSAARRPPGGGSPTRTKGAQR